ncbi:MAG: hypothetical protein ABIH08_03485 [Candidatus Omnitrophota bacterium]
MIKNSLKKYYNYIDINAEAIYEICKNKLSSLKDIIKIILKDIG